MCLMDKLIFDFSFNHLKYLQEYNGGDTLSLWIFHVDKIPPHVGISQDGIFYSLKSNGKDYSLESSVFQIIENKSIKCLIVKLRNKSNKADIQAVFDQYERAFSAEVSCLTPIKEILGLDKYIPKLSSLLFELESRNMIVGYCGFNVTKSECGILNYDVSDIDKRLNLLHA